MSRDDCGIDAAAKEVLLLLSMITVANRWHEKAGLRTGCGVRSQVIDVLKAQIKRRPAMKKGNTVATKQGREMTDSKVK